MSAFFPPSEKQYLTRDQETVDRICWDYYGFTTGTVERVYRRNSWLATLPPILPRGLIITLPVVPNNLITNEIELWNYKKPLKVLPTRKGQDGNGLTISLVGYNEDCCVPADPPIVEDAQWIAVWYFEDGRFKLGRIARSSIDCCSYGGYSYTGQVTEIGGDELLPIL